jgi:hypothetical protein
LPNFDEYFPFDPGYGASANAARWQKMAKLWAADGVVANYLNQMKATMVGNIVTVQTGAVFIHGYYAEIQANQAITVGTNGTIVAQANFNTEIVTLVYRDGIIDYGSNPNNSYEQDTNIWEIPIWLISGGVLVDLRNLINPATGLRWWTSSAPTLTITTSTTGQYNIMTARIPYAAQGFIHGTLLVTFSDLSQAQSAACTLTYQYGVSGEQALSPTVTPAISAGGAGGQAISIPVSLTGIVSVLPGKKIAGWRVTAGTGPAIQVAQMTLSLWAGGIPAAA